MHTRNLGTLQMPLNIIKDRSLNTAHQMSLPNFERPRRRRLRTTKRLTSIRRRLSKREKRETSASRKPTGQVPSKLIQKRFSVPLKTHEATPIVQLLLQS